LSLKETEKQQTIDTRSKSDIKDCDAPAAAVCSFPTMSGFSAFLKPGNTPSTPTTTPFSAPSSTPSTTPAAQPPTHRNPFPNEGQLITDEP